MIVYIVHKLLDILASLGEEVAYTLNACITAVHSVLGRSRALISLKELVEKRFVNIRELCERRVRGSVFEIRIAQRKKPIVELCTETFIRHQISVAKNSGIFRVHVKQAVLLIVILFYRICIRVLRAADSAEFHIIQAEAPASVVVRICAVNGGGFPN